MGRAYNKIAELGYVHKCVNHSENFVDPDDNTIHTQNIERLWRDLKEWMQRPGNRLQYFKQYISRYIFLHKYPEDQLLHFFISASCLYPPQGDRQRPQPQPQEEEEDTTEEEEL